jgi:hypothetical protein
MLPLIQQYICVNGFLHAVASVSRQFLLGSIAVLNGVEKEFFLVVSVSDTSLPSLCIV